MSEQLVQTRIKAGPIEHLTDARYFAAYGVDWLTFCFDQQREGYVSPEIALQIKNWLSGPAIVGQFGDDWENAAEIAAFVGIDAIQVKGSQVIACREMIASKGLSISAIFAEIGTDFTLGRTLQGTDGLFFEASFSLEEVEIESIQEDLMEFSDQLVLSANFDVESLRKIVSSVNPYAVNFSGGNEEKTGIKDYEKLDELLELLRQES